MGVSTCVGAKGVKSGSNCVGAKGGTDPRDPRVAIEFTELQGGSKNAFKFLGLYNQYTFLIELL